MKSISGIMLTYRGCPIGYKSLRQSIRCYSTFESEYVAISDGLSFVEGLPWIGCWTEGTSNMKIQLFVDNTTAITVASTCHTALKPKSRHFRLRFLKAQEQSKNIHYCPTKLQLADILTKYSSAITNTHMFLKDFSLG